MEKAANRKAGLGVVTQGLAAAPAGALANAAAARSGGWRRRSRGLQPRRRPARACVPCTHAGVRACAAAHAPSADRPHNWHTDHTLLHCARVSS
eukprot:364620-Chlamydomonas_euryale.AAC.12